MKLLYEFEVNGTKYAVKKPSRFDLDEAGLFYNAKVAEAIRKGVMSAAVMLKQLQEDGGIYDKERQSKIDGINRELPKIQKEKEAIEKKPTKTKKDEAKLKEIEKKLNEAYEEYANIRNETDTVLSNTAEKWAQQKLIEWWIVNLSHQMVDEEWVKFFNGETLDEMLLDSDDKYDSEDENVKSAANKFAGAVAYWNTVGEMNKKDVDKVLQDIEDAKSET